MFFRLFGFHVCVMCVCVCSPTHLQPETVAVDLGVLPPGDIMPRVVLGVLIVNSVRRGWWRVGVCCVTEVARQRKWEMRWNPPPMTRPASTYSNNRRKEKEKKT